VNALPFYMPEYEYRYDGEVSEDSCHDHFTAADVKDNCEQRDEQKSGGRQPSELRHGTVSPGALRLYCCAASSVLEA